MRVLGRGGWVVVVLALGALLGLAWYVARQGQPQVLSASPTSTVSDPLAPALVYYQHTEYIRNKKDEIRWKLVVDKSILHKNESLTLEGVQQATYFRDNEPLASLRADRAHLNHQTQNIVINGNIRVASPLGLLLECDELRWLEREQKMVCPQLKRAKYRTATLDTQRVYFLVEKNEIACPDPLQVKDVDAEAKAHRATANLKTHWFDLYGPAKVIVMVSLEETITGHRRSGTMELGSPLTPHSSPLTPHPSLRARLGWRRWLACGLLTLFGTPALAQPAAAAQEQPARAGAAKSPRKKVIVEIGEGGRIQYNSKTNAFKARKNVVVTIPDDEVKVWCDQADYTGDEGEKKGILTATGNLRMKDPENELTGKLLTVYTEEKRAVITDNVVLVHTPKDKPPEGERSRLDEYRYSPTTMTCDKVEYWYKTGQRKALATGNLKFKQKDRNGTAEKATFYNEDQVVDLEGQVHVEDAEGQKFQASLVRILLEENDILVTGPVRFEFFPEEEEETPAPPSAEETPSGPQAPPFPGFEEEGEGPGETPGPEGGTGEGAEATE